jgi:hypothetical protein
MVNRVDTTDFYKRKVTTREDMERLSITDNCFLTGVIHGIEEKLEEVSRKSVIWEAVSDQVTKEIRLELPVLLSKTGSLEATIGKQVKNEMPGTEAPTVWSAITSLSTMLHETQTRLQESVGLSGMIKDELKNDVDKYLEQRLSTTGVSQTFKADITQELAKYMESDCQ